MKVFFVNAVCGTGSTGRIVTDLLHTLRAQGHDGKIAFGVGEAKNVSPGDAVKIGGKLNYYLHNALSRLTDHAGLYSKAATRRLIRAIREYDPDVIHLHNLHGYYVNYEMLFAFLKTYGKKVVWTLHDCWAFTGHCAHYSYVGCQKWQTLCHHCSQPKAYPKCYTKGDAEKNFARKKAAFYGVPNLTVVTPSQWLADEVKKSFLKNYPVEVIHNGIDLEIFHHRESDFRQRYGLEGKKIILGVANVWNKRKGLDDFIELSKLLDDSYKIVLVGLTSEQKEALPEGILGITRTGNATELAEIYSAADVFVNLSYEDTYPTVNLEAQACGTPVLTYDTGGCAETILPNGGIVVPQGDLTAVIAEMQKLFGVSVPKAPVLGRPVFASNQLEFYKETLYP